MLGLRKNDMQPGDIILLPNLPDPGTFSLCRIASGEYLFQPIWLEDRYHDCGHIRPAQLNSGCEGIPYGNARVGEGIQRTLRCRSRLWRIDHLADEIQAVLDGAKQDTMFVGIDGTEIRFARLLGEVKHAHRAAEHNARERIRGQLTHDRLREVARAEKLESLLVRVLCAGSFPPPARVDRTGGRGERGADVVVRIGDPFDHEEDALIVIQLKDHERQTGVDGLKQLQDAISYHGTGDTRQGRVIEAVLATLAEDFTEDVPRAAAALQKETGVKVQLVRRPRLLQIFADGLLTLASRIGE